MSEANLSLAAVSAVIPTYNGLKLLQKNLPAVLDCLQDGDECLVVDDASSDESVAWLSEQFKCRSQTSPIPGTNVLIGKEIKPKKNYHYFCFS